MRAAACGGGIGILAAAFKTLGPWRAADAAYGMADRFAANLSEVAAAALAFACLCGGAALLRNLVARRLIEPDSGRRAD